ncbi:hypothetical protein B0T18DRAFT_487928 [Schizothecium vesticola]|uniref:Uncharacterized protein n=1 Tax=Schizothecium vesticola TaxID=314040 RepID=A0AA40F348_9PEZI|nr:hypothetical protein B0T18DRAFT_487928 [Schizothecium vesticola]
MPICGTGNHAEYKSSFRACCQWKGEKDQHHSTSNNSNTYNRQLHCHLHPITYFPPSSLPTLTSMTSTTTAPKERPAETRSVDTLIEDAPSVYPYPRWWSSIERGCLLALSIGVLANVGYLFGSVGDVEMGRLVTGILGGFVGVLSNGISVILLIRNKYGPKGYWIWNCLWDIITAACCAGGFATGIDSGVQEGYRGRNKVLDTAKDSLMWLCLITAIAHLAANIAGFYGIHLVNKRGRVPGAAEHDDLDV